jgi:uncharacterized Zn finger protein (UPF0148 family)
MWLRFKTKGLCMSGELEEAEVADEKCPECGEPVVEGRLNCPKCGSAYANLDNKELERDPEEQGD